MLDFILKHLTMHGYGPYVWGAVFFSLSLQAVYYFYVQRLFKRVIRRVQYTAGKKK